MPLHHLRLLPRLGCVLASLALLLLAAGDAQAALEIEVTSGVRDPVPIAIVPFAHTAADGGLDVADVIQHVHDNGTAEGCESIEGADLDAIETLIIKHTGNVESDPAGWPRWTDRGQYITHDSADADAFRPYEPTEAERLWLATGGGVDTRWAEASAAELLRTRGYDTVAVRREVTSPGGITARGLDALERAGLRAAFSDALDAVLQSPGEHRPKAS